MPRTVFGLVPSDAARRAADQINLHVSALGHEAFRKYVAIRLSDGGSDGTLYDTRADAIRHQLHEQQCAYFRIPPFGEMAKPVECESFLTLHRSLYDAGRRLADPDAPEIIRPLISVAAPGRRGARLARQFRGEWK